MGRYTGPKGRVNRRLGAMVFENAGATRALENKPNPPGQAGRRRKLSNYGLAMVEKQKIKFYYGLRERQLRLYFDRARAMKGNTGEQLLVLCEQRLDNVVRRSGLAETRPQARQAIVHSHFQVNGKTVNKPSIQVRPGDVITVRNRPNLVALYRERAESASSTPCDWLNFDSSNLEVSVVANPSYDDVSLPVNVGQVVALISR